MGKQQGWSVPACVFLFLSLASQIYCRDQPSLRTGPSGVSQNSTKENDLIESLPGQPPANFKQYGGYVAVNEKADRFLYYYFVEAINANDSTPLVIWFNGGPGGSSLQGAFNAQGPFRIQSDGKTLYRNPHSWNNEANVLFIEGPIGVGFSYSNTPIDIDQEAASGDPRTAEENYMFLVNWLERFPEYKKRELYITGASYAGHYVPQLAQIILHRNNHTFINLRGVMMGNPALDPLNFLEEDKYAFETLADHDFLSQDLWDSYKKLCQGIAGTPCWELVASVKTKFTSKLNRYNMYAPPMCQNPTLSNKPKEITRELQTDPCAGGYLRAYLNTKEVQEAMHANTTKIPYAWINLNSDLNRKWNPEQQYEISQIPILHELMGKGIRVWVYSGIFDLAVPTKSTMAVLKLMNLTVENPWSWWYSGGQLAGSKETYKGNLTFATVIGAGHSVAGDQPMRALTLFTSFLRNTLLPPN